MNQYPASTHISRLEWLAFISLLSGFALIAGLCVAAAVWAISRAWGALR